MLLPTQLGYHFWPDFASVLGLRIDYLSPTVYLTDILVGLILLGWWWDRRKKGDKGEKGKRGNWGIWGVLGIFLLINCFLAENRGAAVYKLVKLVEMVLLGLYVAKNRYLLRVTCYVLPWVLIYSSLIAIAQFFKQASLGEGFWWLGERTFNSVTPGIAQAEIFGRQVLRPYGTFSHPNSLSGFLLVSWIVVMGEGLEGKEGKKGRLGILRWLGLGLGVVTIFLSFSRAVWGVGLVLGILGILGRLGKWGRWRWVILGLGVIGGLGGLGGLGGFWESSLSFQRRMVLNQAAWQMMKASPLFGVGLNNFIPRLPEFWRSVEAIRFLQPVHNIYLLIGAEIGVFGVLGVFWGLYKTIKKIYREKRFSILYSLFSILLLGLFDHYWFTLQQNQLLLAIVLGLAWRREKI